MENIQSLNAAYATSGPMYLSDHEGVGSTATYPKGTMTLGRATSRAMYGGRVTAMGSSPNIASVGLPHHADLLSYSDLGSLSMLHHHHHQGVPSALLRQAVRGSGGELLEMQAQLRDMQRENELLRRELDLKDSKLGSSTNSIKSFWSPELKKERIMRKEEVARTSILKEQMRVTHEENQVRPAFSALIILPLLQWFSIPFGFSLLLLICASLLSTIHSTARYHCHHPFKKRVKPLCNGNKVPDDAESMSERPLESGNRK